MSNASRLRGVISDAAWSTALSLSEARDASGSSCTTTIVPIRILCNCGRGKSITDMRSADTTQSPRSAPQRHDASRPTELAPCPVGVAIPPLLTTVLSALATSALALPSAMSPPAGLASTHKPRPGEVVLAVVSLRRALNNVAEDLASAQGIELALPELSPLPRWVRPRPLIYVGPVPGGYSVIPLTTLNGQPPETLDLLLQNIIIPLGETASALPFFQGQISFQTQPRWRHHEERPSYIIPHQIVVPAKVDLSSANRFMSARTLNDLLDHCRDTLGSLAELSKEDLEMILDSYTQAAFGTPLYHTVVDSQDTDTHAPDELDVAPSDHDAVQAAAPVPSASPPMQLNPLAAVFTPQLRPGAGVIDILDLASRLSLASGGSSIAQPSISSVLQDNSRLPAGDATARRRLRGEGEPSAVSVTRVIVFALVCS